MGQAAHSKHKDYLKLKENNRRFATKQSLQEERTKELEWKQQEVVDKEEQDSTYDLLSAFEY